MDGHGGYGQEMGAAPSADRQGDMFAGGFPIGMGGMQVALDTGRQYAEGIIGRLINIKELRRYFAVSTDYVLNKLKLILFPYTKRGTWERSVLQIKGEHGETYPPPRADINAPDLYIPVMGFITYVVFCAIVAGFAGGFKPEMLGVVGTKALVFFALDVAVLRLGYYLLASSSQSLLDCVALCGYVFVGVALNEFAAMIGGKWLLYPCLLFTCAGISVFLMQTVRVILLADPNPAPADSYGPSGYSEPSYGYSGNIEGSHDPAIREQSHRRYYLLFLAVMQFIVMYFLAFSPSGSSPSATVNQMQQQGMYDGNGVAGYPNQQQA